MSHSKQGFDLLVVPGVGHGLMETSYARRRLQDFSCGTCWPRAVLGRYSDALTGASN